MNAREAPVLVQAVLGGDAQRPGITGGQRRDEEGGPAHVERGVGERDLLGKQAPRAGRRRLLGRNPHHDREIAPERDAHHLTAGHRDDSSVQRGRRVVGVAFELGGDRHDFAARLAHRMPELRVRREQARNPRRAGKPQATATGEFGSDRQRSLAAGAPERAHRRMGFRLRALATDCHFEVDVEGNRDRVERRAEIGRGCRNANTNAIAHRMRASRADDTKPRVLGATVLNVQRQCARPGCSLAASATFTFDAAEQTVWLDVPVDDGARAGELCERHVQALTPPQGWRLDDRRGKREAAAHELAHTLDARSPLLSRAFRNSGAV